MKDEGGWMATSTSVILVINSKQLSALDYIMSCSRESPAIWLSAALSARFI